MQIVLLDEMKRLSANRHARVNIEGVWSGTGFSGLDKRKTLDSLERNGDIVAHDVSDGFPADLLKRYAQSIGYGVPSEFLLTDRTWERMVNGSDSPRQIVINELGSLQMQSTNGGNIVGSPIVSGNEKSQVNVRSGDAQLIAGFDPRALDQLIGALRRDAGDDQSRPRDAEQLDALADDLEVEVDSPHPDVSKVETVVERAGRLADRAAGLMTATRKALEALGL